MDAVVTPGLGEFLLFLGLLVVSLGLLGVPVLANVWYARRTGNSWLDFAARVGTLKVERGWFGWPTLAGEYRGRSVQGSLGLPFSSFWSFCPR
jgi:hypothetical protein